jgi:hypothetical protein
VHVLALLLGWLLIGFVLWDLFETVVLPRRVSRRFRLARWFYRSTWLPYRALGRRQRPGRFRESFLSVYGPASLLFLLVTWAASLVFGFALLHWGLGTPLRTTMGLSGFVADLYYSGTTFLTLGLGDVAPASTAERAVTVWEAGTGFGMLALVIGYLPTLAQAFARREAHISRLDARAGSPPTALALLQRHAGPDGAEALSVLLDEWEQWCADLLETHVSFPVLAYYRSQHDNQSWVAALTMILDTCAIIIAGLEASAQRPARTTFAIASHAAHDLCTVLRQSPRPVGADRLPPAALMRLRAALQSSGHALEIGAEVDARITRMRGAYEPYMNALANFLMMPLPTLLPVAGAKDNWQTTA